MDYTYHQLEEAVYEHLLAKREQDPSLNFSLRKRKSKGAEADIFIGTESSGYFAFSLWDIPVSYPGASVDLLTYSIHLRNENELRARFEYFMNQKEIEDEQNRVNLLLGKQLKKKFETFPGAKISDGDGQTTFSIKIDISYEQKEVDDLLTDLDKLLADTIPLVDEAITELGSQHPDWKAKRFTEADFEQMQAQSQDRVQRYQDSPQRRDQEEQELIDYLSQFPSENNLATFFNTAHHIFQAIGLTDPDHPKLACTPLKDKGILGVNIAQRRVISLEKGQPDNMYLILPHGREDLLKSQISLFFYEAFKNPKNNLPEEAPFLARQELREDTLLSESLVSAVVQAAKTELHKPGISPYKRHHNQALARAIMDPDYCTNLFGMVSFSDEMEEIKQPTNPGNDSKQPLNQILFGPPGTGKTYHTINHALDICGEQTQGRDRKELKALFEQKVEAGQIVFTTFHQSMSYEDFVEGIKPQEPNKEGDPVIYKIENGIFKRLCQQAETYSRSIPGANIETRLRFERALKQLRIQLEESEKNEVEIKMVQKAFHITSINDTHIKFRKASGGTGHDLVISVLRDIYLGDREYNPQGLGIYYHPLADFLRNWDQRETAAPEGADEKNFVLIIDEINRGNVSEIFGELITLIEADKRLGNEEALEAILPYSKERLGVPPNLYILATMNTADRSVEALDTALRRRFSFVEMPPKPDVIREAGKAGNGTVDGIDLVALLVLINRRIEKILDKDHLIGHSYFLSVDSLQKLKTTFQNKILPLLQEYFFGDFGKIGLVLGKGFFEEDLQTEESDLFAEFNGYESEGFLDRPVYHLRHVAEMPDDEFHFAIDQLFRRKS
jgi:hypothetical protein